ncbi:hypothetical protein KKF11_02280 [Patescibacteria group bacterium]|nr:hypothetical protein [Patescibacteria group bacterium]
MKIQKKDGSLEDFDRAKITNGLAKAGASLDQAESIAGQIETWIQNTAVNGSISSNEIKAKVLDFLQPVNPDAAAKFGAYQKPVSPTE